MNNLHLNVLDEYARHLTPSQVKILNERLVVKLNKKKKLNESLFDNILDMEKDLVFNVKRDEEINLENLPEKLFLQNFFIQRYFDMEPIEFTIFLDTNFPELKDLPCTIEDDGVSFNISGTTGTALINILRQHGVPTNTITSMIAAQNKK